MFFFKKKTLDSKLIKKKKKIKGCGFTFFFGKLTYVLKEEDTNIIRGNHGFTMITET